MKNVLFNAGNSTKRLYWNLVLFTLTIALFQNHVNGQVSAANASKLEVSSMQSKHSSVGSSSKLTGQGDIHKEFWKNEPFGQRDASKELTEKRDAFSKHFQNENGSITAHIASGPIHYQENGEWKTIYHTIEPSANGGFQNTYNSFKTYYPATASGEIVTILPDGTEMRDMQGMRMYYEVNGQEVDAMNIANTPGSVDFNKLTYSGVYGSQIDLRLTQNSTQRKMDYLLQSASALNGAPQNAQYLVFEEKISLPQGVTAKLVENKIILSNAKGEVIAEYTNPDIYDEQPFQTDDQNYVHRSEATYQIEQNGNLLTIKTKVQMIWLLDVNRNFPVVVDPTVNVIQFFTLPAGRYSLVRNTQNSTSFVNSQSCDNWYDGNSSLLVGRASNASNRSRFLFSQTTFDLGSIPAGSTINSSQLYYYVWGYNGTGSGTLSIRRHTENQINSCGSIFSGMTNDEYFTNSTYNAGWKNGPVTPGDIQNNLAAGWFGIGYWPAGSYGGTDRFWDIDGVDWSSRPYIVVDYSESCTNPVIVTNLSDVNVCEGSDANWLVEANGTNLTYEWQFADAISPSVWNLLNLSPSANPGPITDFTLIGSNAIYNGYKIRVIVRSGSCETITNESTLNISTLSTAPTLNATSPVCPGTSVAVAATGGTAGTGSDIYWYTGPNGTGTSLGTGSSYTISSVNATQTIYARREGTCNTTVDATFEIVTDAMTALGSNNDAKTCAVNQNGFVHFTQNGRLIASVNSNGQNLGNVTATSYVHGQPLNVASCDNPGLNQFNTAVMGRSWVINPAHQPSNPVRVRLYYDENEYNLLQDASQANSNQNDDLISMDGLGLSKYHNAANPSLVNNSPDDNCPSGSSTFHLQSAFDAASAIVPGFNANGFYIEFEIPSFSEFWLHGSSSGTPLPVALTSFSANCTEEGSVLVNWTTASEQNSSHFEVSRSVDGLNWKNVVITESAGNSNVTQNYFYLDNESGRNFVGYYRLVQFDLDGKSTTYNPIMVSCQGDNGVSLSVQPNPINGSAQFTASGFNQGTAQFYIQDVSGKRIVERQLELNNGTMSFSADLSTCAPGIYIAKLIDQNGESKTVRIIKD